MKADGSSTDIAKKIDVRRPGRNLKFSLAAAGLRAITFAAAALFGHDGHLDQGVHPHMGGDGGQARGRADLAPGTTSRLWRCNEFVRDALYSRFYTLSNSGIFYDGKAGDPDTRDRRRHLKPSSRATPDGGAA